MESPRDDRCLPECPDRELLSHLVLGKLAPDAIDGVGLHVEVCTACQAVLELLDSLDDSFTKGFKGDPISGPAPHGAELEQQLEAAEAISEVAWNAAPASTALGANSDQLPRHLGQYLLLEKIGHGGMGVVFKARHEKLKRLVAVKLLPPGRVASAAAVERFHREMAMVASLDHPNVVRAHDANEVDGQHFLVMEFVDGVNLSQLIRQQGPLSVSNACEVIRQAARGIQSAHEHGLVHRDIKPSNLILARDGKVKVLDLGLARLRSEENRAADATDSHQIVGTADYMAPEQGMDARNADARSDLYSLGCTFYFLLAGKPPFSEHGDTAMKKVLAHSQTPIPSINRVRADVPALVVGLLDSLLAKRSNDRPATASAVADALEALRTGADLQAVVAGRSRTDATPLPSLARNNGRRWLALMSVLVLLAIVGAIAWPSHGRDPKAAAKPAQKSAGIDVQRDVQKRDAVASPANETTSDARLARKPRPASWALGKPPRSRLTETGAGVWQPERSDRFHTWQVIGPFLHDSTDTAFILFHPIEQDWIALGEAFDTSAGKRSWHPLEVYTPSTDLSKLTGAPVPSGKAGVYYAVCWAKFPSGTRALGWELVSPCGWKFFVNGKPVQQSKDGRVGEGTGLQRILDDGWNEILLKLVVPAERSDSFRPFFSFQVIRGPSPSGRIDDDLLPHSMNEPPE